VSGVRLVTFVDLGSGDEGPDGRRLSVSARMDAVLDTGRRVVLVDGRGWASQVGAYWDHEPTPEERASVEQSSAWAFETVESIQETARDVVGPDGAYGAYTQAEMDAAHWDGLAAIVRACGIDIDGAGLRALPHEVELSQRVLARLGAHPERQTSANAGAYRNTPRISLVQAASVRIWKCSLHAGSGGKTPSVSARRKPNRR
jgi:hypothetical protein